MEKTCAKCGIEKDLEGEFYADKRNKDGRQGTCKGCVIRLSKEWAAANRERANETSRRAYKRNPLPTRVRTARWSKLNRDRVRAKMARWIEANPETWRECKRAAEASRRARKLGYEGEPYQASDLARLFISQGGLCSYCMVTLEPGYHVDHVVPLSRGGGNGPDNICLACPACNLSKNSKLLLVEWLPPSVVNFPLTGIVT